MRMSPRRFVLLASLAVAGALHPGCSTTNAPQPGSPAFLWTAAKENFAVRDYSKTSEQLNKLLASENEYTARAQAWQLVLLSGMAHGYMDVADDLETGIRAKKADPGGFRKFVSNYRSAGGRISLGFAEAFLRFQKTKDDPVLLAFAYPSGSVARVPELVRAAQGLPLKETEIETATRRAQERQILLETSAAAGSPGDSAKALEAFKAGEVRVPRAAFLTAMANSLYEHAQFYGPRKLDDPEKLKMFSKLASGVLDGLPQTKETKELSAKLKQPPKK